MKATTTTLITDLLETSLRFQRARLSKTRRRYRKIAKKVNATLYEKNPY